MLVVGVLLASAPAAAQVSVSPETIAVSLAAGESTEVTLTVSNAGTDTSFALSLAPAEDETDGEPGDFLFASAPEAVQSAPGDLAMTPDGRIFVAEGSGRKETWEFTPELDFVREFEHPITSNPAGTIGISYDDGNGTLWWLDVLGSPVEQALLLEGSLDGTATGRSIPVPFVETAICDWLSGRPILLARIRAHLPAGEEDDAEPRFYYLDGRNDTIWSIDTLGQAADGYPVAQTDYAGRPSPFNKNGCLINSGLDAHVLSGEPVLEVVTGYPFVHPQNRATKVVVTDLEGRNRGVETPLFDLPTPDGFGEVWRLTGVVRSRVDPSVLYLMVLTGVFVDFRDWVYAVRAAPLPPVWLHGSPILFETERVATELTLTLDATGLEAGVYEAVASVRAGDGIGPVVAEVPVMLTVPTTGSDEGPDPVPPFRLGEPYPNPASGNVTVPVTLSRSAAVRLVVFDVLGREVSVLHDGPLASGQHRFSLDAARLPAGVYLVRAATVGTAVTSRVVLLR